MLAGISVLIAAVTFAVLLIDSQTLGSHGRSFLAVMAYAAATAAVWIVYEYTPSIPDPRHRIHGADLMLAA